MKEYTIVADGITTYTKKEKVVIKNITSDEIATVIQDTITEMIDTYKGYYEHGDIDSSDFMKYTSCIYFDYLAVLDNMFIAKLITHNEYTSLKVWLDEEVPIDCR